MEMVGCPTHSSFSLVGLAKRPTYEWEQVSQTHGRWSWLHGSLCISIKDLNHGLRECHQAKNLWQRIIPQMTDPTFFSIPFDVWLSTNLQNKYSWCSSFKNWKTTFGITYWLLRKQWNTFIFGGSPSNIEELKHEIFRMTEYTFQASIIESTISGHHAYKEEKLISWTLPPHNWIKINANRALRGSTDTTCTCVIGCDSHGQWLGGHIRNNGPCSVL